MFYGNVTNNYVYDVTINGTTVDNGGGTGSTGGLCKAHITLKFFMGDILVLDLAENKIQGYKSHRNRGCAYWAINP